MYGNSHNSSFEQTIPVVEPTPDQVTKMRESVNDVAEYVSSQLTSEFTVSGQLVDEAKGSKMRILIMGPMGQITFDMDVNEEMFDEGTNPVPKKDVDKIGGQIVASMVSSLQMGQPDDVDFPAS